MNQLAFADRLVLPGRNALLDALTLRQLEEQQLRRQAAIAQALVIEQHEQQRQRQQQLADLQATLAHRQHLELYSGRTTDGATPYNALTQQSLLEQLLREREQSLVTTSGGSVLSNLSGAMTGHGGQQPVPQYAQLPSIVAENQDISVRRDPADGVAAPGATSTAGTTGNLSLAGMSAEDFEALVRIMEEQNRRRPT